jgi:hypothetical protein
MIYALRFEIIIQRAVDNESNKKQFHNYSIMQQE